MNYFFVGGELNGQTFSNVEDIPLEITGYMPNRTKERELGQVTHCSELDNQPCFKGYLSPMWDKHSIRYETPEVYELLSM